MSKRRLSIALSISRPKNRSAIHDAVLRTCRSHLGEAVLMEWSDGAISAKGVSRVSRSAKRDGLNIKMIDLLAQLGSDNFANASRDLFTLLEHSGVASNITETGGEVFKHCILPTTVVKLISRSRSAFKRHLCPSQETCKRFWRDFLSTPEGLDYQRIHPHLRGRTVADLSRCIPCRVHEDAGPYSKIRSVTVISWSSMLGRGIDLETKYCTIRQLERPA